MQRGPSSLPLVQSHAVYSVTKKRTIHLLLFLYRVDSRRTSFGNKLDIQTMVLADRVLDENVLGDSFSKVSERSIRSANDSTEAKQDNKHSPSWSGEVLIILTVFSSVAGTLLLIALAIFYRVSEKRYNHIVAHSLLLVLSLDWTEDLWVSNARHLLGFLGSCWAKN